MPKSIEQRILAALRIDARCGNGPQTVAQLHRRPGLTGRRSSEIFAAATLLYYEGKLDLWGPISREVPARQMRYSVRGPVTDYLKHKTPAIPGAD